MIIREKYLKAIRGFYDSDLIKVITGIRRCGKSVILETIKNEIKEKTDNIIYLNFEKTTDFAKASNAEELVDYVKKNRKAYLCRYHNIEEKIKKKMFNWFIITNLLNCNYHHYVIVQFFNYC